MIKEYIIYVLLSAVLNSLFYDVFVKIQSYFTSDIFWSVGGIFEIIPGVANAIPYWYGGAAKTNLSRGVTGITGHAETVEVTFHRKIV